MHLSSKVIFGSLLSVGSIVSMSSHAGVVPAYDFTGPELIFGDGIGIEGFSVVTGDNGESVALRARNRDDANPSAISGNVYTVDGGVSQVVTPGNPQLQFDFQFTSGPNPDPDYWLELAVDFDPTVGTSFATVAGPVFLTGGLFNWGALNTNECIPSNAVVACTWAGDDADSDWAVGNSWNLGFNFWSAINPAAASYDPFAPGLYDIMLTAFEFETPDQEGNDSAGRGAQVASVRIQAQVVPAPGSIALLGLGLLLLQRRRKMVS